MHTLKDEKIEIKIKEKLTQLDCWCYYLWLLTKNGLELGLELESTESLQEEEEYYEGLR